MQTNPVINPYNQTVSNIKTITWPRGLFIFSLVLFLMLLLFYFGINYYTKIKSDYNATLDKEIENIRNGFSLEKEAEIINFENRLNNLSQLLANHTYLSKLFANLEANTHQKIYFNNFEFDEDQSVLKLGGVAQSYTVLAEALNAFSQDKDVLSVDFKDLKTGTGGVTFSLELKMNPQLIKP
jgi:Tfp pilus assembly protein PilN